MSTDAVQPSPRRIIRLAVTPVTQSRNPELSCPVKSSQGIRKPSAVERLEADKAKYVKSQQVALKKQQPITCSSNNSQSGQGAQQPSRKIPAKPTRSETPPLNLEHLCKLIDGVRDTTAPVVSTQASSTEKAQDATDPCKAISATPSPLEEPSVGSISSQGKASVEASGVNGCPTMTVRRVDVRPQLPQMRMAGRPQLQNRSQVQLGTPQVQINLMRLLRPYTQPKQPIDFKRFHNVTNVTRGPIKPPNSAAQTSPSSKSPSSPLPIKPNTEPLSRTSSTPLTPTSVASSLAKNDFQSPPSPAITRLSSTSSKKRPSLIRSKSDVSDCFSRAGVELERFFNYCGLDPSDLEELARPGSDIVSVSRLRSASAPASERTAEGEDEEEEAAKDERPVYGVSVIERNARVIKWLYGMRQAKESPKVANM